MRLEIKCCDAMPNTNVMRLVHLKGYHYRELPTAGQVFLDELFDKIIPDLLDRVSSDLALMRSLT